MATSERNVGTDKPGVNPEVLDVLEQVIHGLPSQLLP
jgi:hypothetical protein